MAAWQVVSGLVVLLLTWLLSTFISKFRRAGRAFPKGPPAWPIIGHLPLLLSGCPHRTLARLSRTPAAAGHGAGAGDGDGYGPLIGLRLGSIPTVVACSAAVAKDILLTHDKAFANRPRYRFVDNLLYGYDNSASFSSYCPRWSKLRKIYALELFTAKRLHELQHLRQESVRGLLHRIHEASAGGTQPVQLIDHFGEMSSHTLSRLLQSKTLSEAGGDSFPGLLAEIEEEVAPSLGDFFPCLRFLDFPRLRRMKDLHARIDSVMDSILLKRRQAMKASQPQQLPHDFLQVLLLKEAIGSQHVEEEELLSAQQIKGSMFDILGAGTHTTTLTLEWAMAELLQNPHSLCKLQSEIDKVMCNKGEDLVKDEHLLDLPYLECVVKEVLRLHPVVPLLLPRVSSIEAKVDTYTLPKHTHIMVNAWAIGRDPKAWENAGEFLPERFDGKEIDVKGQHFDLIPFGAGRRICPGMRLALSIISTTLANLVRIFDWELPPRISALDIDMSEKRGITSCKAIPLLAIPKTRHNT